MTRAENKTKPSDVTPNEFLSTITHPQRQEDGYTLLNIFTRVTQLEPKMWGASIIGYGRYYYKYDSGREGHHLITGFSPRKSAISIYIMPGYQDLSSHLEKLGKHKLGKSCLYINKLSDVEISVLEEIIRFGVDYMKSNYQTWEE